ncbi:MAG: TonB-dependent receptor [Bacteroidetes bacterium]|nr:TonB-dependent receptor [Bacteroidota bacterium]
MQTILSLQDKNKISVAKNFSSLLIAVCLFSNFSFSQYLPIRNRAVWKSHAKADTTKGQKHEAKANNSLPPMGGDGGGLDTAKRLTEFIVTASRTEKKIEDVGRSVTVISSEEIKKSGANSLAELLSLAEGIYITGTQQNFGANQSLFMRGANSNQSVVMLDGIPIADPSTPNSALDLSELSLMDIDRIEIVRGSHSTLYGSSAIGGVINIITNKKMKEGLNMNVTGTAGNFGKGTSLLSENVGMNYTFSNGLYAGLTFANADINGLDATVDTSTAVPKVPRDKDNFNRFDYGGKIGFTNHRWNLFLSQRNSETHSDIDAGAFADDNNYTLALTRKLFSYGISCRVDSGFTVSLNGGHSILSRTALNDSSLVDNLGNYDHIYSNQVYSAETFTNEMQFKFSQKSFHVILGGGMNDQTMNQKYFSSYYGTIYQGDLDSLKLASRTNSFFILTDISGTAFSEKVKNFSLALGARSNRNNTFGSSITYQVNPMLKVSSTSSIYVNISTGYNAPSLYQLHSPDKTDSITRGNINLHPETSLTKEFGVYQKINESTGLRIGYFQTVVKDIVEYVYLWDKNIPVNSLSYSDYRGDTYLNLGTLTTEGIEFEAHGAIGKKFLVAGNFTYLRGHQLNSYEAIDTVKTKGNHVQLVSNGGFVDQKDISVNGLSRRPSAATISLTYSPVEKFFLKAVVKTIGGRNDIVYDYSLGPYGALGKMPLTSYTLVDFISGATFSSNLSALVRVENIFNINYTEIIGYTTRGRGIYLSVHYSF